MGSAEPLIRPFRASDFAALYPLWQAALDSSWPLTVPYLQRMLSASTTHHFVAEADGHLIGFVATQNDEAGESGGISLLMVRPEWRRLGIPATAATVPNASPELVSCSASQGSAIR